MSLELNKKKILRKVLRSLNGSIKIISSLERDPPIIVVANMQMNNELKKLKNDHVEKEIMNSLLPVNEYRKQYWKLEQRINQSFLLKMKRSFYLPGNSPEVGSLKNSLSSEIIKGDERLWIYSFDHYIGSISEKVGRPKEEAPSGKIVWDYVLKKNISEIEGLINKANEVLPCLYRLKAKISVYMNKQNRTWESIKIKNPKITTVERPLRKIMILKRPIPLPKKQKRPRKRVIKRPQLKTIGPEDFN